MPPPRSPTTPRPPSDQRLCLLGKQNHDLQARLQTLTTNIDKLDGSTTSISLDNFERISNAYENLYTHGGFRRRRKSHEGVVPNESRSQESSTMQMDLLGLPTENSQQDMETNSIVQPRRHSISEGDLPRQRHRSHTVTHCVTLSQTTNIPEDEPDTLSALKRSTRTREVCPGDVQTATAVTVTELSAGVTPTAKLGEDCLFPPIVPARRRHSIDVSADLGRHLHRLSPEGYKGSFERLETIGEAAMARLRPRHDPSHHRGIPAHLYPEFFHIYCHDSPGGRYQHHEPFHGAGPRRRSRSLGASDLMPSRHGERRDHPHVPPPIPEYRVMSSLRPSNAVVQAGEQGLASWCGMSRKRLERVQALDNNGEGKQASEYQ
ncbi:uncharacterized protein LOC106162279 [Lingula anatina]|uniref:Uncharacterized protein LOC106162279 n=1 Tax=Lingula anatina TaxID=7574 RepID=A0A1S3IAS3_LINAN|nr:uncharacterized protein LOC106162279 [Lingula anatina]XP_013394956.1 uncharacterized protein LOC106162279 [Lingula anatina]|eukprot:XP_013394954.1 uncharacterized protein LOC106162279 [Lingula anatina]